MDGDSAVHHLSFAIRISHFPGRSDRMRFINLYLIGYFILILGALAALWYGGVLRHVSGMWIAIGLVIAVGLGIMLSVSGGKPTITNE